MNNSNKETLNRRQRLCLSHTWLTDKQATQLLTAKYLQFTAEGHDNHNLQCLMEKQLIIWGCVDEERLRDLLAMAQEFV